MAGGNKTVKAGQLPPASTVPDPVNVLTAFGAALLGPTAVQNLGQRQSRVQAINAQSQNDRAKFNVAQEQRAAEA